MQLKIRGKIILTIASVLVFSLLAVTIIVIRQSGKWFNDAAKEKLETVANIVLLSLKESFNEQLTNLQSVAQDENVLSPTSLLIDLLQSNPNATFDDAYIEMSKGIALRLKDLADRSKGLDYVEYYGAGNNLIAFVKKDEHLTGWLVGNGKYAGMAGDANKDVVNVPTEIQTKYSAVFPDKASTGIDVFRDFISATALMPAVETSGDKKKPVGFIKVVTLMDKGYAENMSKLTKTHINFFVDKKLSAGVLDAYTTINDEDFGEYSKQYESTANKETFSYENEISIADENFYEEMYPFSKDGKLIGTMSIMLSKRNTEAKQNGAIILLITIMAIATAIGIMIAAWFSNAITTPLRRAVDISDNLARGNLAVEIDIKGNDETAQLLRSMKNMVEQLQNALGSVKSAAGNVAGASHELLTSSEEMTARMSEQTEKTLQLSTSAGQISQTVIDIARNASNIASSATMTAKTAKEGEGIVGKSVEEVKAIADTVRESAKMIASLGDQSKQIGEIVSVINDIADQTNLLALNAAIEAARAGEHGRGFAVVADEVRKLAERTAKATSEISTMIGSIQQEVSKAVSSMKEGTDRVELGVQFSTKAGESLRNIVESVEELQSMVQQIASATEEMSAATEQNTTDLGDVSHVANEVLSRFSGISQAANGLAGLSTTLQDIVGKFNLSQTNGYKSAPRLSLT